MTTHDVAQDLTALLKQGKFDAAGEKYWAEDVVSIEPMGDNAVSHGKAAAKAKGEWWVNAHDIHGVQVEGPYVNGDQFTLRLTMDITTKETGVRHSMDEHALYTIKGCKIVEERFFYGA